MSQQDNQSKMSDSLNMNKHGIIGHNMNEKEIANKHSANPYHSYFDNKINHIAILQADSIKQFQRQIKELQNTFVQFMNHIHNILLQKITEIINCYKKQYLQKIQTIQQNFVHGKIKFFIGKYKRKYQKYLEQVDQNDCKANVITNIINGALDDQFQSSMSSINDFLNMPFPTAQFEANNNLVLQFLRDIEYSQEKLVKIKGNHAYQMILAQTQAEKLRKQQQDFQAKIKQQQQVQMLTPLQNSIEQITSLPKEQLIPIQCKQQTIKKLTNSNCDPYVAIEQFKKSKKQREQAKMLKIIDKSNDRSHQIATIKSQLKNSRIKQLNRIKQELLKNIK